MELQKLKNLNLLYVEDDAFISKSYAASFELFFHTVFIQSNYEEAMECFFENKIDIVLVDIELKNSQNGFAIVQKIREQNIHIPIVFLSSYSDKKYLLKALHLQVDGYIIKPLDIEEFQKSMLRCLRRIESNNIIYLDGIFMYDMDSHELFENGIHVKLGKKENLLLHLLLQNKTKIVSRGDLEYHVWGDDEVSESAVKNLIASLRNKIGKEKILNISKIGWKIDIKQQ